jgi:hypothetical protein
MRATDPTIKQRIEDVLRLRLEGVEGWDLRRYVAGKEQAGEPPWAIPSGGKPLSERQIRRYVEQADQLIEENCRTSRKKLLRRHLAQRRQLFRKAVAADDLRAALAVLDSEAKLEGLFDYEVMRQVEELERRVAKLIKGSDGDGNGASSGGADNAREDPAWP